MLRSLPGLLIWCGQNLKHYDFGIRFPFFIFVRSKVNFFLSIKFLNFWFKNGRDEKLCKMDVHKRRPSTMKKNAV